MRDVICGQDLSREPYVFRLDYKGDTYAFCSLRCRRVFEAEPEKYARPVLARALGRFVGFLKSQGDEGAGKCC